METLDSMLTLRVYVFIYGIREFISVFMCKKKYFFFQMKYFKIGWFNSNFLYNF